MGSALKRKFTKGELFLQTVQRNRCVFQHGNRNLDDVTASKSER